MIIDNQRPETQKSWTASLINLHSTKMVVFCKVNQLKVMNLNLLITLEIWCKLLGWPILKNKTNKKKQSSKQNNLLSCQTSNKNNSNSPWMLKLKTLVDQQFLCQLKGTTVKSTHLQPGYLALWSSSIIWRNQLTCKSLRLLSKLVQVLPNRATIFHQWMFHKWN